MKKKTENNSWFLADIVERTEPVGADKSNPNRRPMRDRDEESSLKADRSDRTNGYRKYRIAGTME